MFAQLSRTTKLAVSAGALAITGVAALLWIVLDPRKYEQASGHDGVSHVVYVQGAPTWATFVCIGALVLGLLLAICCFARVRRGR